MKRRILALLLVFAMFAALMPGCAAGKQETAANDTAQTEQTAPEQTAESAAEETEAAEETAEPAEETAAEPETLAFTDSLEREVELPRDITRIAPSGAVATMILAAIAPECMVTVNATPSESQMAFLPANLASLPETGQMYGSKANLNLETLVAFSIIIGLICALIVHYKIPVARQIVKIYIELFRNTPLLVQLFFIYFGLPKVGLSISAEVCGVAGLALLGGSYMAEAFRMLGSLLSGKADRGQELADLVDRTTTMAAENSAKITDDMRVRAMYTTGEDGLGTNAAGSIQAQVLDMVGVENAVVVEDVSNKGGGNVISLEQLYNFDPDVILFADGSIYDTVTDDSAWSQLTAISTGKYYEVPCSPYSWLSGPPSMNMILGVWWLGNLIYPEIYDYDMAEMTQEFYKTLWGYELSSDEVTALLANSTLKAAQ